MRNIRRNKSYEELVRQLTSVQHPVSGKPIFPTIRELMCFAATLGFQFGEKPQLGSAINDVDGRRFGDHSDTVDLMCLLALADERDGEVLLNAREEDRIRIFEEYANGGFGIMQKWLKALPSDIYGDKAILSGLIDDGGLDVNISLDDVVGDIEF